jgi:ferritin-like metal-binding protein YciE
MPTTRGRSSVRTRRNKPENRSQSKSSRGSSLKSSSRKSTKPENGSGDSHSQLEKLFTDSLRDLYWAEKQLTKTLPKLKKKATTDELKSAIEEHLAQTEEHVSRLEHVFNLCGKKAQAKKCDAMEGLIKEGDSIIEETENNSLTRDAGLIMAAQKVEHYEIASYGSLVQFAKTLGMDDVAELLHKTLDEEKHADEKLTEIAEWHVNQGAAQQEEKESEEEEDDEENENEMEEEDVQQGEER